MATADLDDIKETLRSHGETLKAILEELSGDRHTAGIREDLRNLKKLVALIGALAMAAASQIVVSVVGFFTGGKV